MPRGDFQTEFYMEASAMKHEYEYETQQVKEDACGRWERVLLTLAPPLKDAMERKGKHVPCPVHGGRDGFRVFRDVDETGGGICNTCGSFANGFALLMWINGWDFGRAIREVAEQVGSRSRKAKSRTEKSEDEIRREQLNRTWRESVPLSHSSAEPARLYLARRGLSVKVPESLRFHAALGYFDDNRLIANYPALIAQVTGHEGDAVTIHRTYLASDGRKAPVDAPKKLMRHPLARQLTGGAIRLVPAGNRLAVTEGIETALAVTEAIGIPTWATGNAHLLATFQPPAGIEQVLVFADKDRPSQQHPSGHGQEAARELVTRLWAMGIRAGAIAPALDIPEGRKGVDWLDVFVHQGKAGFPALGCVEQALHRAA
jgi:putative DNA primase/helicase